MGIVSKHLTEEVVPPGQLMPELDLPVAVDLDCYAGDGQVAAERYGLAAEVQADLESALASAHAGPARRTLLGACRHVAIARGHGITDRLARIGPGRGRRATAPARPG